MTHHQPSYEQHGIELLDALSLDDYRSAIGYAQNFTQRRDKATGGEHGGYGIEREFHDNVVDGDDLYRVAPAIFDLYLRCHNLAQMRLDGPHVVNFSPWRQSAITLKSYTEPGDEHGWHVETNGLTVIVMAEGRGKLDYMPAGQEPDGMNQRRAFMDTGAAWMLRGHDVWHCVPPMTPSDLPRTTLIMNYYLDDDFSRPEGIDEQHYA